MLKIWNWLKRDFRSVSESIHYTTKRKVPKWRIVVWYVVMLPIGILLMPVAIGYSKYLQCKLNRIIREVRGS